MTTGVAFRDECVHLGTGKRYDSRQPFRFGPNSYDCSGLMEVAARNLGLAIPGSSWTQARWCHQAGTDGLTVAQALAIPGALLFEGPNQGFAGFGNDGHVACSMGDGVHTMEAHSAHTVPQVGQFVALGRPWSNAARIPGINYGSGAAQPPPLIKGNPMYASDEFVHVFTDGHGSTWGLRATGAIYTLTGTDFWGAYGNLVDAHGHPLEARDDFGYITARWDQRDGQPVKPGYSLWPLHFTNPMQHYDFGPDHPGRLARALTELQEAIVGSPTHPVT